MPAAVVGAACATVAEVVAKVAILVCSSCCCSILGVDMSTSATLPFMHGSRTPGGSYRVPGSQSFVFTGGRMRPDLITEMRTEYGYR